MRVLPLLLCAMSFACGACGASTPPPTSAAPATSSEPAPDAPPKGSVHGGSLAPVEVKKALTAKKDEVRACYHALLEKSPKKSQPSGKVVIRFTVDESGAVEETVILNETSLPNETAQCIADVVKTVTFPKPTGGKARITYPWEFTAQ